MIKDIFSEENMQKYAVAVGAAVDRVPSWALKIIGFPCWFSAVFTFFFAFQGMTTSQRIIYGMIPAVVGSICGLILMIRTGPPSSS